MQFRQLIYFVAVAKELSVSRAASKLHISQPPLTRQIQLLEKELGTQLFIRSIKGVTLTSTGHLFLKDALQILELTQQTKLRVTQSQLGNSGSIDVAVFGSVMFGTVSELLASFQAKYPKVRIVLHTMNKGEQIQALREKQINLGFSRLAVNTVGIGSELVKHERLLVALHQNSPLAKNKKIKIKDLEGYPLVLFASGQRPNFIDSILNLFQKNLIQPFIKQTVEDSVTGVAFVAAGFGGCLIPESVAYLKLPNVVYLPVSDVPKGFIDLNCLYRLDEESPIARNFLDLLKAYKKS